MHLHVKCLRILFGCLIDAAADSADRIVGAASVGLAEMKEIVVGAEIVVVVQCMVP